MTRAADPISLEPGSEDWWRRMTASKVAAVLGLSPYESPFSLWFRMKGTAAPQEQTRAMQAGHYLEDAICRYVADQVGLWAVAGGTWENRERPWQVATPDRRACRNARGNGWRVDTVIEAKTAGSWEAWGREGTDDVPPHVRAQVLWQLDVLGLEVGYVGALLSASQLRWYEVRPYAGELDYVRGECQSFLDSLAGDQPPNVDGHDETYRVLRALHPEIENREVEVPAALAVEWTSAVHRLRAAEAAHALARARVAQHMGTARKALHDGALIARRQSNGGAPYVKAPDRVPLFTEKGETDDPGQGPGTVDHADVRATG